MLFHRQIGSCMENYVINCKLLTHFIKYTLLIWTTKIARMT